MVFPLSTRSRGIFGDGMGTGCRGVDQYECEMIKYMLALGCAPGAPGRSHIADVLSAVDKELKQPMARLSNFNYLNYSNLFSVAVLCVCLSIYSDGACLCFLS